VVDTGLLRTITIPHRENIHINPTARAALNASTDG
jgi:hypothetical protein